MKVGPYVVEATIGKGGMGTVHRARHGVLGTTVALKELTHADPAARDLFVAEARLLFGLKHANFPTVLDLIDVRGRAFLVMDFIEGPTLSAVVAARKLTTSEAALLGCGLCGALQFLHGNRVLHRDIKPDNILLPRGLADPVLVDFGIACAMGGNAANAFTPGMAPPEQVAGLACGVTSDIYQVGATLFFSISGLAPKDASLRVNDDDLGPGALDVDGRAAAIAPAIRSALRLDPVHRPSSATELRRLLQAPGQPPFAPPPSAARVRPFDIRR